MIYRNSILALDSLTPISDGPYLIGRRTYSMGGIVVWLADVIFGTPLPEHVYMPFLDVLPTVNWSGVRDKNCILSVECGDGGRVVPVDCLVIGGTEGTNRLGGFWIGHVFQFLLRGN